MISEEVEQGAGKTERDKISLSYCKTMEKMCYPFIHVHIRTYVQCRYTMYIDNTHLQCAVCRLPTFNLHSNALH